MRKESGRYTIVLSSEKAPEVEGTSDLDWRHWEDESYGFIRRALVKASVRSASAIALVLSYPLIRFILELEKTSSCRDLAQELRALIPEIPEGFLHYKQRPIFVEGRRVPKWWVPLYETLPAVHVGEGLEDVAPEEPPESEDDRRRDSALSTSVTWPTFFRYLRKWGDATMPKCPHCESEDTAKYLVGIVSASLAIAAATRKVKLLANGPAPGSHICRACGKSFGKFVVGD